LVRVPIPFIHPAMSTLARVTLFASGVAVQGETFHCSPWGDQLSGAKGLAVDGKGSVFVASSQGLHVCGTSGSCRTTGVGACEDVAIGQDGDMYIISRFSDSVVQKCGIDGSCNPVGNGEPWEYPVGLTVVNTDVLVFDAYHGLKKCAASSNCTSVKVDGYVLPTDLTSSGGEAYSTDTGRSQGVVKCDATGICQSVVGFDAFGLGKLEPHAIAVDTEHVYLGGESGTGDASWVQRCSLSGNCEQVGNGWSGISGIAVDAAGHIYVSSGGSVKQCVAASNMDGFVVA